MRRDDEERSEVIFFSEKKLARKLHEGQVTEKEQMIYLLLWSAFLSLCMTNSLSQPLYYDTPLNIYDRIGDLVEVSFTIAITIYCWLVNRKGDDRNFVTRFICLSIPVTLKAFLVLFIPGVIAGLMATDLISASKGILFVIIPAYAFITWRYKVAFEIASGKVELK